MDEAIIWETCTKIFRETFGDDRLSIGPDTTAHDVEGWDSLTHIQLLVTLEKAFGMRFNTGEVAGLANVGEMVNLIARRAGSRPSRS
jgi:acyl carrier protein